jgi:hypothetical protein
MEETNIMDKNNTLSIKIKDKILYFLVTISVALGVYFRLNKLNYPYYPADDYIMAIGSLKIHHQSFVDGVKFVWNHPPLGKYMAGLFTNINSGAEYFEILKAIPAQMLGYSHLAAEALYDNIMLIRGSYVFFGLLSILLVFLITKKLYSTKIALIASALFSLSLDFISFSRNLYPEHFMVFFMLLSTYFYIEYIYFSRKKIWLILLAGALLFLVNSRQFQPVFITLIIAGHYILRNYFYSKKDINKTINKSFDMILVLIFVALATLVFIYKPLPPSQFTHSGIIKFGFQLKKILEVFIFRNSYISLAAFLGLGYLSFKKRDIIKDLFKQPKKIFSKKMIIPFLFVTNVLSLLFFSFEYLALSRYLCHVLALLIILEAQAIDKLLKNNKKIINIILIIVLLLTFFQLQQASTEHPPFVLNSNFNIDKFDLFPDFYGYGYNETIYSELKNMGNPIIMTNQAWLVTFYDGKSITTPLAQFNMCTEEFYNQIRESKIPIIVHTPDFFTSQPWASCESFRQQEFLKVKEFTTLENPRGEFNRTLSILILK